MSTYTREKKIAVICLLFVLVMSMVTGCDIAGGAKVVLTTGFAKNEIFRIENMSCSLSEIMVYLTNAQNQYEGVFGKEIWESTVDGVTLEQNVKDTAMARIAQMKTMNLMASNYGVSLTKEEIQQVRAAAAAYYGSLNETEKEKMLVDESTINTLYAEYALANKVYDYIIKDINPEISDDEARTITVQHLLIKTYALDGTGEKIEFTNDTKEDAYAMAKKVLDLAQEGTEFEELIEKYSEDARGTYSFGKGDMEKAFEDAAFNLGTGEISEIVETEFGYHIIKCISTFNRAETDVNKVKIVEERKKAVFGQEYDDFLQSLTRSLNETLWDSVTFIHDENVTTADFFDVYSDFFKQGNFL